MKRFILHRSMFLVAAVVLSCVPQSLMAQDPVKVDSKHYSVVFENDSVRVLRIAFGPHEKSVMHEHPNGVIVWLTDESTHHTMPDGKTMDTKGKAGDAAPIPAMKHLPENIGDSRFEAILIEFKPKMSKVK